MLWDKQTKMSVATGLTINDLGYCPATVIQIGSYKISMYQECSKLVMGESGVLNFMLFK